MLIGSVQPFSGSEMLISSVKGALSDQENTLMIYTGAPQNTKRTPLNLPQIESGQILMKENGIAPLIVHAPYVINLANTAKEHIFNFGVQFLKEEIQRSEALGATQIVLHPGSHIGAGVEAGIAQVIKGLNEVIAPDQKVQIAIETMAGKGSEVGTSFEQLAEIIDGVKYNEHLSVTFDTCHTSDAGYDIKNNFDGVLAEFDSIIGLERLKVLHLNDSKNVQGAHKDRHENIGLGRLALKL